MDHFKELTIILLHLLFIYQCSNATAVGGACKSPEEIQDEPPMVANPGSKIKLVTHDMSACSHGNTSYVLLYQNQKSGELIRLDVQNNHRVKTPPIYVNTSGMYCVYKQCGTVEMEQCCVKVRVTKMEIIFSESIPLNSKEYGICYVSTWPRWAKSSVKVVTNDPGCKIETLSDRFINEYTTAVFFVIYVNSSCDHVTCFAPLGQEERPINISNNTSTTTSTTVTVTPATTSTTLVTPATTSTIGSIICNGQSGALKPTIHNGCQSRTLGTLHRITLWIIILILCTTCH